MEEQGRLHEAQALHHRSLKEYHKCVVDAIYRYTTVLANFGCLNNAKELVKEMLVMVHALNMRCDKPQGIESILRTADLLQTLERAKCGRISSVMQCYYL